MLKCQLIKHGGDLEIFKEDNQLLNHLISYNAVSKTAPATLGPLLTVYR